MTEFPYFRKLPVELQREIWGWALADANDRVVSISFIREDVGPDLRIPILPSIFRINRQSRTEAFFLAKYWGCLFSVMTAGQNGKWLYFDPETDILELKIVTSGSQTAEILEKYHDLQSIFTSIDISKCMNRIKHLHLAHAENLHWMLFNRLVKDSRAFQNLKYITMATESIINLVAGKRTWNRVTCSPDLEFLLTFPGARQILPSSWAFKTFMTLATTMNRTGKRPSKTELKEYLGALDPNSMPTGGCTAIKLHELGTDGDTFWYMVNVAEVAAPFVILRDLERSERWEDRRKTLMFCVKDCKYAYRRLIMLLRKDDMRVEVPLSHGDDDPRTVLRMI